MADEVFHFQEEKTVEALPATSSVDDDGLWKVPVAQMTESTSKKEGSIPSGAVRPETGKRKLELALRELKILKKAAENAGGDLKITVEPVGISTDDLFIQLTQLGYFDLSQKDNGQVLRIESRISDPYMETLKNQIIALEKRRAALMSSIEVLEKLIRQNKEQFEPLRETEALNPEVEVSQASSQNEPAEVTITLSPSVSR